MKKILNILIILSLTTLSTTVIGCSKIDENGPLTPNLTKVLADLEKETAFNPYEWTKNTADDTIKQDFLNYCHEHIKNFNETLIQKQKDLIVDRQSQIWPNQIIIYIFYNHQSYYIKTGISLEENK